MKIAYFAPIPYNYLKQRPQHIAELLANKHEVVYIEPTISLLHSVIKRDVSWHAKKTESLSGVNILKVSGMLSLPRCLEWYDKLNINTIFEVIQLKPIMNTCDVVWIGDPLWWNVVKNFSTKKIVFDKMDDTSQLVTNPLLKKLIKQNENDIIKNADAVFVTCRKFFDEVSLINKKTYLVRNGVSVDFDAGINKKDSLAEKEGKTIFGYIGAISHWFDFDVFPIILENETHEIVLVGDNQLAEYKHPRVHYHKRVAKDKIPEVINGFDVCLYNFKKNELLDTINPVKIYEYLAMNKPVISVKSEETSELEKELMLYSNLQELKELVEADYKTPFLDECEKLDFLENNSWEKRVEFINQIIEGE